MTGARIGSRIAVFSSTEAVLTSGSFTIDTPGTYKALIGDLQPRGEYVVAGSRVTASAQGTAYVTLSARSANTQVSVTTTGVVARDVPAALSAPTGLRILTR
jgi:hypothetical protein